jgi:hypothetical protein
LRSIPLKVLAIRERDLYVYYITLFACENEAQPIANLNHKLQSLSLATSLSSWFTCLDVCGQPSIDSSNSVPVIVSQELILVFDRVEGVISEGDEAESALEECSVCCKLIGNVIL